MATTHTSTGFSYHGTTDGAVGVDAVTLPASYTHLELVNRDAATAITFRVASAVAGSPAAVAGADGTILLPPGCSFVVADPATSPSRVWVVAAAAAAYSIYGLSN